MTKEEFLKDCIEYVRARIKKDLQEGKSQKTVDWYLNYWMAKKVTGLNTRFIMMGELMEDTQEAQTEIIDLYFEEIDTIRKVGVEAHDWFISNRKNLK